MNYYCITLAIFFLPSNVEEEDISKTIISEGLEMDDHEIVEDLSNVVDADIGLHDDEIEKETDENLHKQSDDTEPVYSLE